MNKSEKRLLNERESAVLRALVYEYISSGKPVGSRSFVQKYSFNLSPATMRNIMFDLEAMGFLMQPHTSAGRIPTDIGYRYYVDSLLDTYELTIDESQIIREDVIRKEVHLEKMFISIAKMLSNVSSYAGIVLTPRADFTVIKYIELVQLDLYEILTVFVSRTGMILNKRVTISEIVTQDDLHRFSKFLSSELSGYSFQMIKEKVLGDLRVKLGNSMQFQLAVDIAELALNDCSEQAIFIEGIENVLHLPEMLEERRLKSFLYVIENKPKLSQIINKYVNENHVNTLIGVEIEDENVYDCSLITSNYSIGNMNVGALGVFGPTRMDYEKAVPLVDYTSKAVSSLLNRMSK